ncbi:MAG: TIGR00725 family protein [Caldilineales bacterium]|nr:TIGR00725 family protein [Caldilineales bacterium]MDW8316316.1 TIGR00725 family protein [Anaerolineae bacterium]
MDQARAVRVAVIGGGVCSPEEEAIAEAVGRGLARAGAVVLTGGRGGVMAAASRGAAEAGGLTVGILPGDEASQANPWVRLPIVTGLGEARNAVLMRTAQAVIAIGGEYGTLSEIAFALKFRRPVVGLHTWYGVDKDGVPLPIHRADTPAEAVALALRLAAAGER